MAKEVEDKKVVETPVCARCKTNPKWELTKRTTGEKYFWSLCKSCETDRQRENRGRRKARNTSLVEVVSAKPAARLAKYDVQTVGEFIKSQLDMTSVKGFGPKSQAALMAFIKEAGLD